MSIDWERLDNTEKYFRHGNEQGDKSIAWLCDNLKEAWEENARLRENLKRLEKLADNMLVFSCSQAETNIADFIKEITTEHLSNPKEAKP